MTIRIFWLVTSRRNIDLLHSFVNARIRSCLSEASKDNLVRLRNSASGTIANGVNDRAASQEGEARSQARKLARRRDVDGGFFVEHNDQNWNISALSVGAIQSTSCRVIPNSSKFLGLSSGRSPSSFCSVRTSLIVSSHRRWRPCQTSSHWSWVPGVRVAAFPMFAVTQATLLDTLERTMPFLCGCTVVSAI